jgi:predicted site-specific integrase-resolvase
MHFLLFALNRQGGGAIENETERRVAVYARVSTNSGQDPAMQIQVTEQLLH